MTGALRFGAVLERAGAQWKPFARVCILLAAGVSSGQPAVAQSQMELNEEASKAFSKADNDLNRVYGALAEKVSPAGKEVLRRAQRTWLAFRDQECEFETLGSEGGSIHGMMVLQCQTRLTETRTTDLRAQVTCSEGDLSCGGQ